MQWSLGALRLAQIYEDHAEDYILAAARTNDAKRRDVLLDLAAQWRDEAKALRRGATRPEVASRAPAAVKMKSFLTMAPGDERQIQPLAPCGGHIPSANWVGIAFRAEPAPHDFLICHANHVECEIMEWIAKTPLRQAVFVVGSV